MRGTGYRSLVLGALALLVVGVCLGCDSPLSPISKSDRIEGLTYYSFTSTWDRWDADPQYDGILVTLSYYNEYGDSLKFHDKPHKVVIEFWTQQTVGEEDTNTYIGKDEFVFSKTIVYSNSDDDIRIPIEAYLADLKSNPTFNDAIKNRLEVKGFMLVRVFPPDNYPRPELIPVGFGDQLFWKPELGEETPNP